MNEKDNKVDGSLDSVDQIRDILFGEQIKIIEKRFNLLEQNLNDTISKLADHVEKNNQELHTSLDKSHDALRLSMNELAQKHSENFSQTESRLHNKIIETEAD